MALSRLRTKIFKTCHLCVLCVLVLIAVLLWHRAVQDGAVEHLVPVRRDSADTCITIMPEAPRVRVGYTAQLVCIVTGASFTRFDPPATLSPTLHSSIRVSSLPGGAVMIVEPVERGHAGLYTCHAQGVALELMHVSVELAVEIDDKGNVVSEQPQQISTSQSPSHPPSSSATLSSHITTLTSSQEETASSSSNTPSVHNNWKTSPLNPVTSNPSQSQSPALINITGSSHLPPIKSQGHSLSLPLNSQGHSETLINSQGHSQSPPINSQGHSETLINSQGHSQSPPINSQGHSESPINSQGHSQLPPINSQEKSDVPPTSSSQSPPTNSRDSSQSPPANNRGSPPINSQKKSVVPPTSSSQSPPTDNRGSPPISQGQSVVPPTSSSQSPPANNRGSPPISQGQSVVPPTSSSQSPPADNRGSPPINSRKKSVVPPTSSSQSPPANNQASPKSSTNNRGHPQLNSQGHIKLPPMEVRNSSQRPNPNLNITTSNNNRQSSQFSPGSHVARDKMNAPSLPHPNPYAVRRKRRHMQSEEQNPGKEEGTEAEEWLASELAQIAQLKTESYDWMPKELAEQGKFQRSAVEKYCSQYDSYLHHPSIYNHSVMPQNYDRHMLTDPKHNMLFCFLPKVGCTNLKLLFFVTQGFVPYSELSKARDEVDQEVLSQAVSMRSLSHLRKEVKLYLLSRYFKFIMVRNPLERLASAYRSKIERYNLTGRYRDIPHYNWARHAILRKTHPLLYRQWIRGGMKPIAISFGDFIDYWLHPTHSSFKFDDHFMSYVQICQPCMTRFHFYGNFRHFDRDAEVLIRRIGADSSYLRQSYYNSDGGKSTEEYMKVYYSTLTDDQKKALLKRMSLDLEFHYSIFPEERDSHKQILGVDYDLELPSQTQSHV